MAAIFPFCVCGLLGLNAGDGDAAFEAEVDVVADRLRASIIFRLPAPTSLYHGVALEVNRLCRDIIPILRSYLYFHSVSQHPGGEAGLIMFL